MSADDPVARSDALDVKLGQTIGMERNVQDLMIAGKRNRLLIRVLGASVVFDILLSLALGYVAFTAQTAALKANSLQQQQLATCKAGNQARATTVQLWDYLLTLPPAGPRTPAEQKQLDDLRVYIHRTYAPQRC